MIFNAGELSFVQYGSNELLGSCRTEHMSPHLLSVRMTEGRGGRKGSRAIAYLADSRSIHILDLATGVTVAQISHDAKIDWLEVGRRWASSTRCGGGGGGGGTGLAAEGQHANGSLVDHAAAAARRHVHRPTSVRPRQLSVKADKLLFRDKRQQLHLFDIRRQTRVTLLFFCSYVQWVPGSEVVVAQSRNNLCIWYSIESPERVTMFQIKGDVVDIERAQGKTDVIVDEGISAVSYTLDEGLIEFSSALDELEYERAVDLLESLELTPETEAMWRSLGTVALKDRKVAIAARCHAALGDVATTRYLKAAARAAEEAAGPGQVVEGEEGEASSLLLQARLAMLGKDFKRAEVLLLQQNKVEAAMEMYQEMHKWKLSLRVAEERNHPDLEDLKASYFQWLIQSGQEGAAGKCRQTGAPSPPAGGWGRMRPSPGTGAPRSSRITIAHPPGTRHRRRAARGGWRRAGGHRPLSPWRDAREGVWPADAQAARQPEPGGRGARRLLAQGLRHLRAGRGHI
jgi:intraflagellar transport protein 172